MTITPTSTLDDLRREVDIIDEQLHDLLMARADVVARVAAQQGPGGGPVVQPAREANILRRLVARHQGPLPVPSLVRLWREMMVAMTGLRGHFGVAMYAPVSERDYWDLARAHFGGVDITLYDSASQVLHAIGEGKGQILGLLPFPRGGESWAWWPSLVSAGEGRPRIVGHLPFLRHAASTPPVQAVVVAPYDAGSSGEDMTLVVVITVKEVSRGRLIDWLAAAGLPARPLDARQIGGEGGDTFHLIEIAGAVAGHDDRLRAVLQASDGAIAQIAGIGVYAVPIDI